MKNSDNTNVSFGDLYESDYYTVGLIDKGGVISIGNGTKASPRVLTISVANADGTATVILNEQTEGSYTVTGDEVAIYAYAYNQ